MGRYRKIDPRIHNDAKDRSLSERGKLLFFTILTHPHMTALGAMRATEAGICEEMALGASWRDAGCQTACAPGCTSGCAAGSPAGRAAGVLESYRRAFRDLIGKGLIKFDSGNACLVIPKFLKYNPPESPSVVKAWNAAGDLIPECNLRDELIENTINFLQNYGSADKESFLKAFKLRPQNGQADGETDKQAGAHQEQEPEQEPEQEVKTPPTPLAGGTVFSVQDLACLWNEKAPLELERVGLPFKRKPRDLKKIEDALKRNPNSAWWERVVLRLSKLPFVLGQNDRRWKITLDVMVRDAEKILDGLYANAANVPKSWYAVKNFMNRRETEKGNSSYEERPDHSVIDIN